MFFLMIVTFLLCTRLVLVIFLFVQENESRLPRLLKGPVRTFRVRILATIILQEVRSFPLKTEKEKLCDLLY